jgi:hypothetical protein
MGGMKDECECILCMGSKGPKAATKVKAMAPYNPRPRASREIQIKDRLLTLGEHMEPGSMESNLILTSSQENVPNQFTITTKRSCTNKEAGSLNDCS